MTYQISLEQLTKQKMSIKQMQRLVMSQQMQQAIRLMQMPVQELTVALEEELQNNPVIELLEFNEAVDEAFSSQEVLVENELNFENQDFEVLRKLDEEYRDLFTDRNPSKSQTTEEDKLRSFQESSIMTQLSLIDWLMQQSKETFVNETDLAIAELLIGNVDENGFFKASLDEIVILHNFSLEEVKKVLITIQTFDPAGVGASDLRESMLIQLQRKKKKNSLAYQIVEKHYEDLVHNRILLIKKGLNCSTSDINKSIKQDIAKLDLHPGVDYFSHVIQYITPDASIDYENGELLITINDDYLPSIKVNRRYMRMLDDVNLPIDTRDYIKNKILSIKWFLRNVNQRNETLRKILVVLVDLQEKYFKQEVDYLEPVTMKQIAELIDVHDSTVARAVSNKYVSTSRGMLSLRSFFTSSIQQSDGHTISSQAAKSLLQELIRSEDKHKPYSDEELVSKMKESGVDCARRTVTKYRSELGVGNTQQRKSFSE